MIVHLTIQGEVISTTENHLFYVRGRGFREAGNLIAGEEVINAEGNPLVIEEKRVEFVKEAVTVYNFQVEEFHTYHVGELGVLVHNADYGPEGAGGAGKVQIPEKAKDIVSQIKAKNGTPPQGYRGGKVYQNAPKGSAQKLPDGINYKEYDINPYIKGLDRGVERIVIGDDGSVWYTNNHYETFTKLE